jgi:hypothetical protein
MSLNDEIATDQGVDGVLGHFDVVRPSGAGWMALCPAHDDRNPSLSITEGDDGRILLHCHAGCSTEAVLEAVGLDYRDLFVGCEQGASFVPRRPKPLREEDADFRDRAYRSLLGQMKLLDEHREHLRGRGLTYQAIDANGYRSVGPETAYLDPQPEDDFPRQRLLAVPGFRSETVKYAKDVVERKVMYFEAARGILIPIRDAWGRVVSAQVRRFDGRPKYQWLQGSRSLPHVPLGVKAPCPVLRVTEGPLKADVATCLCPEIPTVGIAGVASWKSALPLIEGLDADEVRLAFDADWRENPAVANALVRFAEELKERGLTVTIETWDGAAGKGIDDLLKGGGRPQPASLSEVKVEAAACITVAQVEKHSPDSNRYGADADAGTNGTAEVGPTKGESNGVGHKGSPGRTLSWPDPVPISHLTTTAASKLTWIWDGFIPDRSVVLMTALWKSGKTTLLGHLLAAMSAGQQEFCGRTLRKCKVLILTQEPDMIWNGRREKFGLSDDVVCFQRGPNGSPRPFVTRPSRLQWEGFTGHLAQVVKEKHFDLVVIDPLADFWSVEDENSAGQVTVALNPLRQVAEAGCSVLMLHHPRKSGGDGGTAHRGSGQLAAHVDVLIEFRRQGKEAETRRRKLHAKGRMDMADDLTIELTDNGYVIVGGSTVAAQNQQATGTAFSPFVQLLPSDGGWATSKELAQGWAEKGDRSDGQATRVLREQLNAAARTGLIHREGTGAKNAPYRFRRK